MVLRQLQSTGKKKKKKTTTASRNMMKPIPVEAALYNVHKSMFLRKQAQVEVDKSNHESKPLNFKEFKHFKDFMSQRSTTIWGQMHVCQHVKCIIKRQNSC